MRGVIPAAGLGKRMAEITNGRAKELLPLAGRPLLSWVLDEAFEAGLDSCQVVLSPVKLPEFEAFRGPKVEFVTQAEPKGLGHAVGQAGPGEALVLLPDSIFWPRRPSQRLVEALHGVDFVIAVESVPSDVVSKYGIVEVSSENRIERILEKPSRYETSSRWAVAGRYVFSPDFMRELARHARDFEGPGELDLSGPLQKALERGAHGLAVPLEPSEIRYDCGSPAGYRKAQAEVRS